ncbi:CopG family transcriptional regulator [Microvenator marinus]|uniref:ribbon-helix-helix domain-containing protein n=1 Tax=Microvenator marinus TaxID=2600177 RepID=UPI00201B92DB|nr:CopG family transcriptional regulator [Microvenator marinus]
MIRTVIALEEEEKEFLDRMAKAEGVSMASIIRRAVREHMERAAAQNTSTLLDQTFGIRGGEDALAYVDRLRDEW